MLQSGFTKSQGHLRQTNATRKQSKVAWLARAKTVFMRADGPERGRRQIPSQKTKTLSARPLPGKEQRRPRRPTSYRGRPNPSAAPALEKRTRPNTPQHAMLASGGRPRRRCETGPSEPRPPFVPEPSPDRGGTLGCPSSRCLRPVAGVEGGGRTDGPRATRHQEKQRLRVLAF